MFQALNVAVFIMLAGKVETGVSYNIRKAGFSKLQELSYSYYDHTPVGWLMARMTSDTAKLSEIIAWGLVDLVWGFTLMTGIAIVMLIMNLKLALIVLSVVPLLAWISKKFQVLILKSYREVRKTNSKITASFNEGIMGAVTSKTLVREDANLFEFEKLTGKMFASSFRAAVQSAIFLPLVQIFSMIGTALAIWFGGSGVIAGDISYGMLVMFLSYAAFFFIPIQELARVFAELQNAQAAAERIITLIETKPEIVDAEGIGSPPLQELKGKICFENVNFEYKKGQSILKDFNLDVEPGSSIALVGETGGGKTSIISLICRFYEPTSGSILIDDLDYRNYPLQWLQSNFGVVLQTPHLFSGTIIENIRYGKLDATDDEIISAAQAVKADAFIQSLPDKYDTEVSEGGTNLSTGQKQLISLARAIIANPSILIMDEATSSVDTETERSIQNAIEVLVKGRTSFIIAHRLSTIRNADRILVIESGKIIESGDHDELIFKNGKYFDLYNHQYRNEKVGSLLSAKE
jgi:ATP-binding cassette subfamily B protein